MYSFFIDGVQLPLTPGKLQVKVKGQNKTLVLVNDGEINFLKSPGLTEISFEATFPMLGGYTFTNYAGGFRAPNYYTEKLESLLLGKKPFQFIVSRTSPNGRLLYDTNMTVSLESYSMTETAKEGFDLTVAVNLKQYVPYGTKTVVVKTSGTKARSVATTTSRPAESAPKAKTHTVVRGDCLWNIAQACYGKGARYPEIYAANQSVLDRRNKGTGLSKYTIYAGQVLTIP